MLEYLIKSAACMALFLLFYRLFLEKESMHLFKRFYLLGALVLSLVIPVLVFTEYVSPVDLTSVSGSSENILSPLDIGSASGTHKKINVPLLLWTVYGLGVLLFGFRFFVHLHQILHNIRNKTKIKEGGITKVLMEKNLPPHTFFRYVFLNKEKFEARAIPREVITHEKAHARQWHSLDILFVELLNVALWFNPLLPWFKKSILLNHEFLADHAVLKSATPIPKYQNILLSFLSPGSEYPSVAMANAINYSSTRAERSRSIKKRFTIMKTKTSKMAMILRILLLFPIIVFLIYGFSEKQIVERETPPITQNILPVQEGASREQMKEYNALAKKYNAMPRNKMRILGKEVERMKYLYGLMSDKQRRDAEPFPNFPEPPMPPEPPSPEATNEALEEPPTPPAPPTPKTPLEHVKEMAQKGAIFYFEGKKISAKKAIQLLETNGELNLVTNHTDDEDYIVRISKKPISRNDISSGKSNPTSKKIAQGWSVSSGAIRNSRVKDSLPIPPVAPTIAFQVDKKSYSKELLKLIDDYITKNKDYEALVNSYQKKQEGSIEGLWVSYNETIESYVLYYNKAKEEGNFVQPIPTYKTRN